MTLMSTYDETISCPEHPQCSYRSRLHKHVCQKGVRFMHVWKRSPKLKAVIRGANCSSLNPRLIPEPYAVPSSLTPDTALDNKSRLSIDHPFLKLYSTSLSSTTCHKDLVVLSATNPDTSLTVSEAHLAGSSDSSPATGLFLSSASPCSLRATFWSVGITSATRRDDLSEHDGSCKKPTRTISGRS